MGLRPGRLPCGSDTRSRAGVWLTRGRLASAAGRHALWLAALLCTCALSARESALPAAKYALLIGIGTYTSAEVPRLLGPGPDVRSLARVLTERYGFEPSRVRVLQDQDGTRKAVLDALDQLTEVTHPGDFVFVYFSGHGTSAFDRDLTLPGLQAQTGALVAADFTRGPPATMRQGLIVGYQDLRPRLSALDKGGRDVVVVFDACHSANTARSMVGKKAVPRYFSLGAMEFGGEAEQAEPWPYDGLVYIAAAGASEKAQDVQDGRLTYDGQPHGSLTDALLRGLAGEANTDGDGLLTYRELFAYARDRVSMNWSHTPQITYRPDREDLLDRPVFRSAGAASMPPPVVSARLRVKLEGLTRTLASRVSAIAGITVVETPDFDLRLAADAGGVGVFHGSGDLLVRIPASDPDAIEARVRRQVAANELLDLRPSAPRFNVRVEMAVPRGVLRVGEQTALDYASDESAYVLLLNLDKDGYITVLHPHDDSEMRPIRAVRLEPITVTLPAGTEFVKAFAFRHKPNGLEAFKAASFDAVSAQAARLVALIRGAQGEWAQARVKVVTEVKP